MGIAKGTNRAAEAAQKAVSSPLLEDGSVEGARGVLLNITGGPGMSLHEVDEAASIIREAADPQANIIVGQVINKDMGDEIIVTVIATGFEREEPVKKPVAAERQAAPAGRAPQPALAGVRAAAEEPPKNLERPTFLRRLTGHKESQERLGLVMEEEWDVPTFLRKQAD
jgi:cell division protein FtsZ